MKAMDTRQMKLADQSLIASAVWSPKAEIKLPTPTKRMWDEPTPTITVTTAPLPFATPQQRSSQQTSSGSVAVAPSIGNLGAVEADQFLLEGVCWSTICTPEN